MVKITFNKNLDRETFLNFFDFKAGGVDFGKKIKDDYPNITKENHERFIDEYYEKNKNDLNSSLEEIKTEINKNEKAFFDAVENIFKEDFRGKEYSGALSMFDCNPRYLDQGIFQVYYKKDLLDKTEVILHEVLHFIFFDYCDRNLSSLVKNLDKNNGRYWALSEIFNVIILNRPEFQNIMKRPELIFYPNLEEIYPKIEEVWSENKGDIKSFVEKSLEILASE